jgi:hypothetical protein
MSPDARRRDAVEATDSVAEFSLSTAESPHLTASPQAASLADRGATP